MSQTNKRSHMAQSETELIERSITGDSAAFEQLVFMYDREVLSIAARFTFSSDDAKDIYQETFIRAFRGLKNFERRSEFSTWLYRIATNVCLTHREKNKKTAMISLDEDASDDAAIYHAVSEKRADTVLFSNEITARIEKALKKLSPKQKLVFTLRHYQDYKLKDIAVMMSCAEGTVKKYLFEATQKMKTHLLDLYE